MVFERFLELQDLSADVNRNFLGKIAVGNGRCDFSDVAHLASQIAGHEFTLSVRSSRCRPRLHLRLAAQLASCLSARHARDFAGNALSWSP